MSPSHCPQKVVAAGLAAEVRVVVVTARVVVRTAEVVTGRRVVVVVRAVVTLPHDVP